MGEVGVIILCNASSKIGEWFREMARFYGDYENLFGEEPGKVQGIGILSQLDLTQSLGIAGETASDPCEQFLGFHSDC